MNTYTTNRLAAALAAVALAASAMTPSVALAQVEAEEPMNMYANSDNIEKEQPVLDEETKQLISAYRSDHSDENFAKLRNAVIASYNVVLNKKEAKLNELKSETQGKPGGDTIVQEMEEIVQEMYVNYWSRINSTMMRFTDPRLLRWTVADAPQYNYIPVMGAGTSIFIGYTTVTNAQYAKFVKATGHAAPANWQDGTYPAGEDELPVNMVSYDDAQAYCEWLTQQDGTHTYRLPSETEWELAAGHMPKDADFNNGINDGRTPVDQYAAVTRGAHGAIDFWGNVWEWTSTELSEDGAATMEVKGGSWQSDRTDCRTEYRGEGRDASQGFDDVGFRVIQVKGGREPAKQVDLTTLAAPVVSATSDSDTSVALTWAPVADATEYQIFEYDVNTELVSMLGTTTDTTATIDGLEAGSTHSYIVQAISDTAISDNVSAQYAAAVTCRQDN